MVFGGTGIAPPNFLLYNNKKRSVYYGIAVWMRRRKQMQYKILPSAVGGEAAVTADGVRFLAREHSENARFSLSFSFSDFAPDAYVFLPACAYDGNRMDKRMGEYPVYFAPEELKAEPMRRITDIPALSVDGGGRLECTAADLSVPCFGIFYREKREGLLVFCEALCKGKRIGFAAEAGEEIRSRLRILSFACDSVPSFFKVFFENRRCLLSDAPAPLAYTEALIEVLEGHMNRDCFDGRYYAEMNHNFKCGWVGGPLTALAMLGCGSALSKENAEKTLDFMCAHTSPEGFFYSFFADGRVLSDGGRDPHMQGAMLVRKNGDGLLALLKVMRKYKKKPAWEAAARKCADGFLRLWRRYGDLGFYVNIESGEMMVGGSSGGAAAISALALASEYFGEEEYLSAATAAAEKYYGDFARLGMTYGGPSDALCAPDSESAYALLECMVTLFEATRDEKFLNYAKNCLYYLSTWVMSYAFPFPEGSEFGRLRINTVGSVFANAQNKHAAPGLCTASGEAIYRLYRYTGQRQILSLLLDIVSFIPQCVSVGARPIDSWDTPKRRLEDGWISERVNTSDWEGEGCVGGVFYYSCWPATSLLLTYAELISDKDFLLDALRGGKNDR